MRESRIEKVKHFQEACLKAGFIEVAPHVFERKGSSPRTLTLCTLVHGNEVGGIEVFLKLLDEIHSQKLNPQSQLRMILGNVNAYYADQRFLETDMNRSFDLPDQLTDEESRANELEPFLADTDVLIDIHQTIGPSITPFFIFEYEEKSYNLARYLDQSIPIVTNTKQRPFKGKTSTAFVISKGGMGITIETGQKGIEDTQISLGLELSRKAVETDFTRTLPSAPITNSFSFHQIIHNPEGKLQLVKKFNNFDPVKKDELLAKDVDTNIHSEVDGVILFPKYGDYAKASLELALILKPFQ